VQHQWPLPAEGEYLFRRLGVRVNVTGFGGEDRDHHPVQSMGASAGTCPYGSAWQLYHTASNYQFEVSNLNTSNPGFPPAYRWRLQSNLALSTYYQVEERYERVPGFTNRFKLAIRVYDAAGTQIFNSANFSDNYNSQGTLEALMGEVGSGTAYFISGTGDVGETCLRCTNIGNQGRNYGSSEYIYYGGFAVRISPNPNAWIGPYQAGEQ
jgi:hypothetical protein